MCLFLSNHQNGPKQEIHTETDKIPPHKGVKHNDIYINNQLQSDLFLTKQQSDIFS